MTKEQTSRIYCSFCTRRGHNRRSCGQLKQMAEKGDYRATKLVAAWKKSDERRSASPRKCSYCAETGHNRRSCKLLKGDYKKAQKLNKMFCQHLLEVLSEEGLGVGTLIRHDRSYNNKPVMGLVTAIDWESINFLTYDGRGDYYLRDMQITPIGTGQQKRDHSLCQFPHILDKINKKITKGTFECRHGVPRITLENKQHSHIVGPIKKESVITQAPKAWKEGKLGLEYIFAERPTRWGRRPTKVKLLTREYVSAWVKTDAENPG